MSKSAFFTTLIINLTIGFIYVWLTMISLERGYEETFVFLAISYGVVSTLLNLLIFYSHRRNK